MATKIRHTRFFPLGNLQSYPGSNVLDMVCFLPDVEDRRRRVWLLTPRGSPVVSIDDVSLEPTAVHDGRPRCIDYGCAEIQMRFSMIRIRGMDTADCAASTLVITEQLDADLGGSTLEDAERRLWGLARCDAGRTCLSPAEAPAGSVVNFTVRYEATAALPSGALVRFCLPKAFTRPQTEDPEGAGYVAIRDGEAVIVERVEDSVESHEKVDIICRLTGGLDAGDAFELTYRAEQTNIFPYTFRAADRRYWWSKLPPLAAATARSEDHDFVCVAEDNCHTFTFTAGAAERLHLVLPGRRRADEPLHLHGVFTDHYRNVPPCGPVDADIELRLESTEGTRPLEGPEGCFTDRHRFRIELPTLTPGVYRVRAVRPGTGEEIAHSNPLQIIEAGNGAPRIFWGEIHAHSEMSDGLGKFAELYRHARDEGALDFTAAADHACYFTDNEWQWMQDTTNGFNDPDRFVTLNGYEWAGRQSHRNVYSSRDRLELFRGMYPPTSTLDTVWRHFHGDDQVVGGPHAPMAHGVKWEHHDPEVERFVEIYSMWGASDDRQNPLRPPMAGESDWHKTAAELLNTGARLGFTGGGDCHEGHAGFSSEDPDGQGVTPHTFAVCLLYRCGMTAAVIPQLDRESLIAALRNRRTYATTGARILLDFSVSDVSMGDVGAAREAVCRFAVHAVDPIKTVTIVRDGEIVCEESAQTLDYASEWTDPDTLSGEHYYYLKVVQEDMQMAWSSPVWISHSE